MLEKVKTALRVNGTAFDGEVADLVEAAKYDLMGAGVVVDDADPLHIQAIICFCKSRFGYEDQNMIDRYWQAYEAHKIHLAIRAGVADTDADPEPERPTLTEIDLSDLDAEQLIMKYGDEAIAYGWKQTDSGYELEKPDGQVVKITTANADDSPGGDSPYAT